MSGWVPIERQKPEAMQRLLVAFKSDIDEWIITIAEYIPPKTVLEEDYLSPECADGFAEYDEERDCYWTPAGWYEWQQTTEINYFLHENITHWMPLPKSPEDKP